MGTDRLPFYKTQILVKLKNNFFRLKPQNAENNKTFKIKKNVQFSNYTIHQLLSVNNFHRYRLKICQIFQSACKTSKTARMPYL